MGEKRRFAKSNRQLKQADKKLDEVAHRLLKVMRTVKMKMAWHVMLSLLKTRRLWLSLLSTFEHK